MHNVTQLKHVAASIQAIPHSIHTDYRKQQQDVFGDQSWHDANIMAKELLPIVLSTAIWAPPYPLTRYCIGVITPVRWLQST